MTEDMSVPEPSALSAALFQPGVFADWVGGFSVMDTGKGTQPRPSNLPIRSPACARSIWPLPAGTSPFGVK